MLIDRYSRKLLEVVELTKLRPGIVILYLLTAAIIVYLFVENFVFSSGFSILAFREIDDLAFQVSIRKAHLAIMEGNVKQLFYLNDYAYGWVYWFFMSIVTLPSFLLDHYFSIEWPLIVTPRQVSLVFTLASLIVIRKIVRLLGGNEVIAALVVLAYILQPQIGYFSLRFGTVSAVSFFCILSVFFTLKVESFKDLNFYRMIVALSVAGAIKLSGLLISPVILLILFSKLELDKYKEQLVDVIKGFFGFIFLISILSFPQLPYVFFFKSNAFESLLNNYISMISKPSGASNISLFDFLIQGIAPSTLSLLSFVSLLCLSILGFNSPRCRLLMLGFTISFSILVLFIGNVLSFTSYMTAFYFLPFIAIVYARKCGVVLVFVVALLGLDFITSLPKFASFNYNGSYRHSNYYLKQANKADDFALASDIYDCVSKDNGSHIYIDFSTPSFLNPLSTPNVCLTWVWNDLKSNSGYCNGSIDYLVFDKSSPGFLNDTDFTSFLSGVEVKGHDRYINDRENRRKVMNGEVFADQKFELKCKFDKALVYKAAE